MEIEVVKKNVQSKKQKPKTQVVVVAQTNKPGKNARKNAKRRARQKANRGLSSGASGPVAYYVDHLEYPDVLGPVRQPRFGSSARTGLSLVRGRQLITGSGTNLIQGCQLVIGSGYSGTLWGNTLTATAGNVGFTVATGMSPSTSFPAPAQVADWNPVAMSMVVTYTGNPLNVAGELVIGSCIPIIGSATYNSMYYYPTTLRVPISYLIENPIRVFGRKLSETANEFVPIANIVGDYEFPYVITANLPASQTVSVEWTVASEYRSTTQEAQVIPFDASGESSFNLAGYFSDAMSKLSEMAAPVSEALPAYLSNTARSLGGGLSKIALGHVSNVATMMTSRYVANLTAGNYRQRPLLRYRDEL